MLSSRHLHKGEARGCINSTSTDCLLQTVWEAKLLSTESERHYGKKDVAIQGSLIMMEVLYKISLFMKQFPLLPSCSILESLAEECPW